MNKELQQGKSVLIKVTSRKTTQFVTNFSDEFVSIFREVQHMYEVKAHGTGLSS